MNIKRRFLLEACIPLAVGIVLIVWGVVVSESMLTGAGTGVVAVSISSLVSLWKLSKGDENELDRRRGVQDERMDLIQGKAAMVAIGVYIFASLVTGFVLLLLDMIIEATIVMGLFFMVDIVFLIALKYYNGKM